MPAAARRDVLWHCVEAVAGKGFGVFLGESLGAWLEFDECDGICCALELRFSDRGYGALNLRV